MKDKDCCQKPHKLRTYSTVMTQQPTHDCLMPFEMPKVLCLDFMSCFQVMFISLPDIISQMPLNTDILINVSINQACSVDCTKIPGMSFKPDVIES